MASDFGGIDVLLLDIEGTICPISFVKDVLFPHALYVLPGFLDENWNDPSFVEYREAFPPECRSDRRAFEAHFRDIVERDLKLSYVKALQGLLWKNGYESGALKAPLFLDVPSFLTQADASGRKIMIYSSGSVSAQKLFFAHTDAHPSDMSVLVSDWFDTVNAGPKNDVASYASILSRYPTIDPVRWLFLSDNLKEVDAARLSGMHAIPVIRPGNPPLSPLHPLSGFAISEFTAASVAKGWTSIEVEEKHPGKGH